MFQSTFEKSLQPDTDDLNFLYGLGFQHSNSYLINYIASKYNSVTESSIRKLLIYDWVESINWFLNKLKIINELGYLSNFCKSYFHDSMFEYDFSNLNRALILLKSLDSNECIDMVDDEKFNDVKIKEIEIPGEASEINKNDFFSYNLDEQKEILFHYYPTKI